MAVRLMKREGQLALSLFFAAKSGSIAAWERKRYHGCDQEYAFTPQRACLYR